MLDALAVFALISGICSILSFALQVYSLVSEARKKAKPSAATDGFDTDSASQDKESAL